MVGVAQDDAGADGGGELVGRQALDRGHPVPTGMKVGVFDHPAGGGDLPQAGPGRAGGFF